MLGIYPTIENSGNSLTSPTLKKWTTVYHYFFLGSNNVKTIMIAEDSLNPLPFLYYKQSVSFSVQKLSVCVWFLISFGNHFHPHFKSHIHPNSPAI